MENVLHMKLGQNIGEVLLDIAQNNIKNGNIEKGLNVYIEGLCGFTKEYALMLLKNQAVLVTDEDGESVRMTDWDPEIKANANNIYDWDGIINSKIELLKGFIEGIRYNEGEFQKVYNGDINNYSINKMMKRYYFTDEQLATIGIHNIAASIIGSPDSKICSKGYSNPSSVWGKFEDKFLYTDDPDASNWEKVLFYTVQYVKIIKMLHKEYMEFESLYNFLVENSFIEKRYKFEELQESIMEILWDFTDTSKGYNHPMADEGLYEYKEKLLDDICKTKAGLEYGQNKILKKDIMDGYDGGWLSPEGEFYGSDGPTSSMIHLRIAEQIFKGTGKYANAMSKDNVSEWSGLNSPERWLEMHGWVKIHHNDCYGSFIGRRDEEPTPDFPYAYNPTDIQIRMICSYADKFYNGKFFTEANALGRDRHPDAYSTYKVRQMDDIMIHEIFKL